MEDRIWVEQSARVLGPDVNVLRGDAPSEKPVAETNGGVTTEVAVTAPVVVHVPHVECRDSYLDIFARFDDREQLITTVEVLNPANKGSSEQGRALYLRKQRQVLEGKTNLVEIDLLRNGRHTTAVPLDLAQARAGRFDYHVCVHHFNNLEDFFVYPILLEQRLPTISIPLLPGDSSVPLDLQAALDRSYDTGPYRRRVRYTDSVPAPALSEQQAVWVAAVLRQQNLLPTDDKTAVE